MIPSPPKWPRNTLLILHGLQGLSLAPWLLVGAFSFMVFDAPGSEENKALWRFVIGVWSYPLWLLLAAAAAWILLVKFRRPRIAVAIAAIFTLPALLLVLWAAFLLALGTFG